MPPETIHTCECGETLETKESKAGRLATMIAKSAPAEREIISWNSSVMYIATEIPRENSN